MGIRSWVGRLGTYVFISVLALTVDISVAGVANWSGFSVPVSATLGYVVGLGFAFPLLRKRVLKPRHSSTLRERVLFGASGLVGIVTTAGISAISHYLVGLSFWFVKAISIGASFIAVFLFRYFLVFDGFSGDDFGA